MFTYTSLSHPPPLVPLFTFKCRAVRSKTLVQIKILVVRFEYVSASLDYDDASKTVQGV